MEVDTEGRLLWSGFLLVDATTPPPLLLSELAALELNRSGGPRYLALERRWSRQMGNDIRLYLLDVAGADDVARRGDRNANKKPTAQEKAPAATVELEQVLSKRPDGRAKWLAKALVQASDGRMDSQSLYSVVAHNRFIEDLTEKSGKKMYRALHANLHVFSSRQRKFLEKECALARKYAATAFQGIQKDNDEDERQEQAANAVEDMMARCRAFVRERQSERGERAENGGEEGDEDGDHPPPALPKAEDHRELAPEPQPPQPEVPKVEPTVTKGVASRSRSEGRLKKEKEKVVKSNKKKAKEASERSSKSRSRDRKRKSRHSSESSGGRRSKRSRRKEKDSESSSDRPRVAQVSGATVRADMGAQYVSVEESDSATMQADATVHYEKRVASLDLQSGSWRARPFEGAPGMFDAVLIAVPGCGVGGDNLLKIHGSWEGMLKQDQNKQLMAAQHDQRWSFAFFLPSDCQAVCERYFGPKVVESLGRGAEANVTIDGVEACDN
eukprot:g25866.t1